MMSEEQVIRRTAYILLRRAPRLPWHLRPGVRFAAQAMLAAADDMDTARCHPTPPARTR